MNRISFSLSLFLSFSLLCSIHWRIWRILLLLLLLFLLLLNLPFPHSRKLSKVKIKTKLKIQINILSIVYIDSYTSYRVRMSLYKHSIIVFALLLGAVVPSLAKDQKRGPKITNKVFFDVEIDGQAAGMYIWMSGISM